jgi:NAD(P)H-nitrite reductase large subunit
MKLGMTLDEKYHGYQLPGKFKMAVSGCHLSCSESWVRDIGLIGLKDGWTLVIGGNVGTKPRIAQECAAGLDDGEAIEAIEKVIEYYQKNAKKGERLGKMTERVGIEVFQQAVGPSAQ